MAGRYLPHGWLNRSRIMAAAVPILLCLAACSNDSDSPVVPEATEEPGTVNIQRLSWSRASLPVNPVGGDGESPTITTQSRVETIRWFMATPMVLRRHMDPDTAPADRDTPVPSMELYLRSETDTWGPSSWGGIMCSPSATGVGFPNMSGMAWLDIWVNDGVVEPAMRSGRLHVDYGRLDEDGFWPIDEQGLRITDRFEQEDGIFTGLPDGVWTSQEDIGLDGRDDEPFAYRADYEIDGDRPYPQINNTARNNREDTEDVDNNGLLDRTNSYYSHVIDLATTVPIIDVIQDYDDVQELFAEGIAWRLYRIPIRRSGTMVDASGFPDLADVRHFRIWFEDSAPWAVPIRRLQLSGIRFHSEAD